MVLFIFYLSLIQKLDTIGNFIWAKNIGLTDERRGQSIVADVTGNLYNMGTFQSTVDFDPGAGTNNITSLGDEDIYLQKLDTLGELIWAHGIGGPFEQKGVSLSIDAFNNIYTTGSFQSTVDFDPGAGTTNLTGGGRSIFIQKLNGSTNLGLENLALPNVKLYPNPSQSLVTIELDNLSDVSIKIYNIRGQLVYSKENINSTIYQLELNESVGVYFVEISTQNKKQVYKLMKK